MTVDPSWGRRRFAALVREPLEVPWGRPPRRILREPGLLSARRPIPRTSTWRLGRRSSSPDGQRAAVEPRFEPQLPQIPRFDLARAGW